MTTHDRLARIALRPTAGLFAAAVASILIGAGAVAHSTGAGFDPAADASDTSVTTYPFDFSPTITAFDVVLTSHDAGLVEPGTSSLAQVMASTAAPTDDDHPEW